MYPGVCGGPFQELFGDIGPYTGFTGAPFLEGTTPRLPFWSLWLEVILSDTQDFLRSFEAFLRFCRGLGFTAIKSREVMRMMKKSRRRKAKNNDNDKDESKLV